MKEQPFKKQLYIALVFLIILLSFNFTLWQITKTRLLDHAKKYFKATSQNILYLLEVRIERYENMIGYGKNYFDSNKTIDREEFQSFFEAVIQRKKEEKIDAIETIAFVEYVKDKNEYISKIRQEKTTNPFRFLYFNVDSTKDKNLYIFNYLAPHLPDNRFFGYEVQQNDLLRGAFEKSIAEDRGVITEPISLFGKGHIFLIRPLYINNGSINIKREDALKGFIVLILSPEKIFDGAFDYQIAQGNITIKTSFDDVNNEPFYIGSSAASKEGETGGQKTQEQQSIPFLDRQIYITTGSNLTSNLTAFEQIAPHLLFIVGTIMLVSFFVVMVSMKLKCEEE